MPVSLPVLLRAHAIRPRKALGQNFLHDEGIARRIVELSGVVPGDAVVEIGPGLGSLTVPLLRQVGRVWAVERDEQLLTPLRTATAVVGELTLVHGDALGVDYRALAQELGGPLRIVANLPYAITTPLLIHLLEQREALRDMTLMVQKEVAVRLAAAPGGKEYGSLSVHCQFWCRIHQVLDVPPGAFIPQPRVDSQVIRLEVRERPAVAVRDPAWFNQVVRTAFGQRRKTLSNALKPLGVPTLPWLEEAGIDPQRRAETLSLAEFARLADEVPLSTG